MIYFMRIVVVLLFMLLPSLANATNKVALVIGNDNYLHIKTLHKAVRDAGDIAQALMDFGYDVQFKHDLNRSNMFKAVRNFKASLKKGDEAVFFFAGHGVAVNGVANQLLPVDIRDGDSDEIIDGSMSLQRVLDDLQEVDVRLSVVVIDACRNNPFPTTHRSVGRRGLVRERTATGQMVIYSAGDGQVALDSLTISGKHDENPNGVFTRVFLTEMKIPGIKIRDIIHNVRQKVAFLAKSVGAKQVPAVYDQVIGDFYFVPANEKKQLDDRDKLKLKIAQLEQELIQSQKGRIAQKKPVRLVRYMQHESTPSRYNVEKAVSDKGMADKEAKLSTLEDLARIAISKYRYSKPKQKSALDYIEKIRAIAPHNERIGELAGLVVAGYLHLADTKLTSDTSKASSYIELARKIALQYELTTSISSVNYIAERLSESLKKNTLKETHTLDLLIPKMVVIPSGSFLMGSLNGDSSEKPVHLVKIKRFNMMETEVTQKLWLFLMAPYWHTKFKGNNNPVESVSWADVQVFISRLNRMTGKSFRLPSEAEWEYAARAGTSSTWNWGDSKNVADSFAWYSKNSDNKTHPVRQKKPNGYGLYDMHGNVWEWVQDCWDSNYKGGLYKTFSKDDKGHFSTGRVDGATCISHTYRGGAWNSKLNSVRSAKRNKAPISATIHGIEVNYSVRPYKRGDLGFRLVHENAEERIIEKKSNAIAVEKERKAKIVASKLGHTDSVRDAIFSPNGKNILSSSSDGTIKLWDVKSGKVLKTFACSGYTRSNIAFSLDGDNFISVCTLNRDHEAIFLWNIDSGKSLELEKAFASGRIEFSPVSNNTIAYLENQGISFLDKKNGKWKYRYRSSSSDSYIDASLDINSYNDSINTFAFSPDGISLIYGDSEYNSLYLWNGYYDKRSRTKTFDGRKMIGINKVSHEKNWINSVAFSPDGKKVVSTGSDKTIKLWDVKSGTLLKTLRWSWFLGLAKVARSVAFSPDSKKIASSGDDGKVRLWDAGSGDLLQTLESDKISANAVAFSPNGKNVLSSNENGTIKLWDVDNGELLKTFR